MGRVAEAERSARATEPTTPLDTLGGPVRRRAKPGVARGKPQRWRASRRTETYMHMHIHAHAHAPSALLELSSLDPGLGARAQDERRAASIARGSRRTRSEKRSGWDYASVGHLVCLVQACVKGLYLYLYLYLCDPVSSPNVKGRGVSPATPCCVDVSRRGFSEVS